MDQVDFQFWKETVVAHYLVKFQTSD